MQVAEYIGEGVLARRPDGRAAYIAIGLYNTSSRRRLDDKRKSILHYPTSSFNAQANQSQPSVTGILHLEAEAS
jgi:hypothetical protein